jgi:steroid delta-isomerase-like uncharacterized protein
MKDLIEELISALNSHDIERVAALYADDYEGTDVSEAQPQIGRPGMRSLISRIYSAFPDIQFTSLETIEHNDRVVLVWSARGTHRGAILNIPATGRSIGMSGIAVLTVRDGRISRGRSMWDLAGLLREMALLPDL